MEEDKKKLNRKWVIRVGVAFLIIMGLLTFFSNTIMNYRLAKVSAQYASSGMLSTTVKGSGTIEATKSTKVLATSARTIDTVSVVAYDEVAAGDVIATLLPAETNDELVQAQTDLDAALLEQKYQELTPEQSADFASYQDAIDAAQEALDAANVDLANANNKATAIAAAQAKIDTANKNIATIQAAIDTITADISNLSSEKSAVDLIISEYDSVIAEMIANGEDTTTKVSERATYISQSNTYAASITTKNTDLTAKNTALTTEQTNLTNAQTEKATASAYLTVDKATKAVTKAQSTLDTAKKTLDNAMKQANVDEIKTEDQLEAQQKNIDDLQKKVDELTLASKQTSIVAPVSGIVANISVASGDAVTKDTVVALIIDPDAGYKVSIDFASTDVKDLQVGMAAQSDMSYNEDDALIISIKPSANSPKNNKTITFQMTGEYYYVGMSINITVSNMNKNYDCIVPNNAIFTDSSGKFVYVLKTKDSPLGTRYVAVKVAVNVLAESDTATAVDDASLQNQYIITSYNKPFEDGSQVRLADEQQEVS